jgi:hypothetical protein
MKTKTFVEGDAALKNFTEAMGTLFRSQKLGSKKPARKKNGNRKTSGRS